MAGHHTLQGAWPRVDAGHAPWLLSTPFVVSVLTIPWRVASPQRPTPFGQKCLFGTKGAQVISNGCATTIKAGRRRQLKLPSWDGGFLG